MIPGTLPEFKITSVHCCEEKNLFATKRENRPRQIVRIKLERHVLYNKSMVDKIKKQADTIIDTQHDSHRGYFMMPNQHKGNVCWNFCLCSHCKHNIQTMLVLLGSVPAATRAYSGAVSNCSMAFLCARDSRAYPLLPATIISFFLCVKAHNVATWLSFTHSIINTQSLTDEN